MGKTILIDNGHGKETPGKKSPDNKLQEWKWAREIAWQIVRELAENGLDARLLTPEESDIKLSERVRRVNAICRQRGTDNVLVVSVHVNAAGNDKKWHNAQGFLSFVSPNAGNGSKRLAKILYEEAEQRGLKGNRWVTKDKYTIKSLAICRDTACTAVLTENLFMDNKEDCKFLLSKEGKHAIVDVHVNAITKFVEQ